MTWREIRADLCELAPAFVLLVGCALITVVCGVIG